MEYLLGMDIGTTNQKAILTSLDGAIAATASRRNVTFTDGNQAEQDAWLWWSNTLEILKEFEQKLGTGALKRVRGICISGQTVSLLPVDAEGNPLRRAMIWMDSRSAPELEQILEKVGRQRYCAIAGGQPSPSFLPSKLLWYRNNEPALFEKTAKVLQANGFVTAKLTGKFTIDQDQAGKSQCLDVTKGIWSREIGDAIGVDLFRLLPTPQSCESIAGFVTAEAAAQTRP